MPSPYILVTVVPGDPAFRLIRIDPGGNPSDEPLLSHAGVIIDDKWHAEVALQGLTGVSRKLRRFWTRVGKDWDEMELKFMAESINMDGPGYFQAVARGNFLNEGCRPPGNALSSDTYIYELRRHPGLRGVTHRSGPGGAR